MERTRCEKPNPFAVMGRKCNKIFFNKYFYLIILCLAGAITALGQEVWGAVLFISLICVCLVICDDILTIALPFLLMCAFLTRCYDSANTFMKFAWLAIPVVLAFAFHFIFYRGKFSVGSSFWGLLAVAFAISLGGVSWISGPEYFSKTSLLYVFSLGIGMIAVYFLLKSQFSIKRDYDIKERIISYFYLMGIFVCFMILIHTLPETKFIGGLVLTNKFQPSNNLCTFLMFAMPCPFFFVPKSKYHLIAPFVMVICMVLSGSRAGIVFGVVELIICLVVSAIWDRPRRFFYICSAVSVVALLVAFRGSIVAILDRMNMYPIVKSDEVRMELIGRAFEMLKKNPIFGHGLGYTGNYDLYRPKKGALGWYHMMIPQIVGSMGIVGIAAYLFQFVIQVRAMALKLKRSVEDRAAVVILSLSYLGVLIMSQVNPGLFCPFPYGIMAVVIFATFDGSGGFDYIYAFGRRVAEKRAIKAAEKAVNHKLDASDDTNEEKITEKPKVYAKRITKARYQTKTRK